MPTSWTAKWLLNGQKKKYFSDAEVEILSTYILLENISFSSISNRVTAPEKTKIRKEITELYLVSSIQRNVSEVKRKWFDP